MRVHRFSVRPGVVRTALAILVSLAWTTIPTHAGLIGFYSFDNSANPLRDESGHGNDLQPGAGNLTDPEYLAGGGVQGGAYSFNGEQHWVAPININPDVLPSLTLGAWVKTTSLAPGLRKVLGHDDGGYDRTIGLDTRNGGFRYVGFIGTGDPPPGAPAPKSTNDWTFLAVTYDELNAQMAVYVDLDSLSIGDALEVSTSPTGMGLGQDTVSIGSLRPDNLDEGWLGLLDNVFFYDEVLTLQQLTAIRDGGKSAILGSGGEDPDLKLTTVPQLRNLPKAPAVQSFSYGIKNAGATQTLTISKVTVSGADAARYAVIEFPASLAAGASGTIQFSFNSQGQVGAFAGTLVVESNDPTSPVISLDVSVQVGDDPDLVITSAPNLQDLSKLPQVQTLSFGVRNGGIVDTLKINQVTLAGPDAAYFTVKSFPASLPPGATGSIEVTFDNRGQVGSFSATATIDSNDASTPRFEHDLSARVTGNSLLAFYSFDDATDPTKDDSGNGRTLQSAGETTEPLYDAAGGVAGGAYVFDGAQRWLVPLNINPSVIPILTMGAWVRTTALDPGLYKAIGHDDGGWDRVIGLDDRSQVAGGPMPAGTYRYAAFTGENNHGPTQGDPPPTPISSQEWTFLAAVYDQPGSRVTLYVDLDAATTGDTPQAISDAAPMGAGASSTAIGAIAPGGGEGWVGSIDNVFFLGGRIDAAVIKTVRDQGKQALLQLRPDPVLVVPLQPVFGDLTGSQPVTKSVELRNTGQAQALTIAEARITGPQAARYSVADVPATIAAGGSATMKVTFDPQGQEGTFSATLDLISNSTSDRHALLDLAAFVPYASPLIAFYPFDDPAQPLRNATGKGSDLTAPAGAEPIYQSAGGVEGGGYLFTGGQRLIAPIDINSSKLPRLTMGAWVRTDSLVSGLRKVIGQDDGGWDRAIGLDNREGTGAFRYSGFTGTGLVPEGPTPVNTTDWTFLAATYDQDLGIMSLYVDLDVSIVTDPLGVYEAPANHGAGFTTTAIGDVRPDGLASEGWQGSIDNVFFYQTALTLEELTRIRDGGANAIVPQPAQGPRITGVQKTANLTITWTSAAGKNYVVQYTDRLSAAWTQIATVVGQGASTTYTDSDTARMGLPVGFYRVGLQP